MTRGSIGGGRDRKPTRRPKTRRTPSRAQSRSKDAAPAERRQTDASGRSRKGTRGPSRRPGGFGRIVKAVAIFLVLTLLAVVVTGCAVYASMVSTLPDPDITKARGRDQSTVILDRNGTEIAKLFAEENRKDVALARTPTHLRQAVIATEDKRFYKHEGVDPVGIARALVIDILRGEKAQGGSTITQQYVKQAFVTSEKTLRRKVQEAILAQKVERRYTKDEILERYLNAIYFGHGAYGVEAASRVYFGKSVTKLDVAEAALLAGVIKSPGRYSPYLEPEAARERRDTVLGQMRDQGFLDRATFEEAVAAPVTTVGLKPRSNVAPYFVEWVKEQLVDEFGERLVYRGGLTVSTTLDLRMQRAAEKAVESVLDRKGDPSASLVAVKPGTGEVLAMVGGRDFTKQQFNVAVHGRRQPGSAFKTFVLATALEQGVSPEQTYESGPVRLPVATGTWRVTGAGGSRSGPMRLRSATEQSVNSVFAQLIVDIGPDKVVETAGRMGIHSDVRAVPAIALGGLDVGVSPLEMAEAYATLANGGRHADSFGIAKVTSPSGDVLIRRTQKPRRVLDETIAFLTTDILTGVIRRGTGRAASIGRPAAGKTGTTQRYRDAWFVGYTPDLATAVWVGYPDAQREMVSVHGERVSGGSFPARIWSRFMRAALEGEPKTPFKRPKGLKAVTVCEETGLAVAPFCPKPFKALFLSESSVESCTVHTTPSEITVPSLVGMTKEEALALLDSLSALVHIVERVIDGVPPGVVARQSPRAGTRIEPSVAVTLTVSAGRRVNAAPIAAFVPPGSVTAGRQARLDGSPSTDDTGIIQYYWEFGDGSTGTGKHASHTWASPGTYEVTLWVTDEHGEQGSVTHPVTVR